MSTLNREQGKIPKKKLVMRAGKYRNQVGHRTNDLCSIPRLGKDISIHITRPTNAQMLDVFILIIRSPTCLDRYCDPHQGN